jgi:hypothetical protein
MGSTAVEAWTEMNLVPVRTMDHDLLVELVDPLVHEQLGEEIATWFFFWEPELRLRIRWREPDRAEEHRRTLAALLDSAKADGQVEDWYEGAHGARGETYVGEADHYGDEVWPLIQRDWMNGSELALAFIKLERAGRLTKPREYHWKRHVHLYTNQVLGPWEAEIELCLQQALAYTKLRRAPPTPEAARLIAELHNFRKGD